jgi:hypothetical protein
MLPRRRPLPETEDTLSGRVTLYFRRTVDSFSEKLTHRAIRPIPAAAREVTAPLREVPTPANLITLPKASPVLVSAAAPKKPPMLPRPIVREPGAPAILTQGAPMIAAPRPARRWPLVLLVATVLLGAIVVSRTPASAHVTHPPQPRVYTPVRVALDPAPTLTRADTNVVHFDDIVAVQPKKAKARRAKVKPAKAKPAAPNPIDELAEAQLRAAER